VCGISGLFTRQLFEEQVAVINKIVDDQRLRGPDYQAVEKIAGIHSQIVFGHNRLSIIDLSQQANQPMWDYSRQYCIVYNGEIYNYRELRDELIALGYKFKTQSDTEVILNAFQAWGIDMLQRFNGPFAFALFDKLKEELWLCRDRFGVKPLFYCWYEDSLYFASSTRQLAKAFSFSPNLQYVARGLRYLVYEDNTDICAYEKLCAVPSSHYLLVKPHGETAFTFQIKKYYDLEQRIVHLKEQLVSCSEEDILNRIKDSLDQAVAFRLRADVPVGVSLSSGLDSSTIALLASQKHSNIKAFCFGSPTVKTSEGWLVNNLAKQKQLSVEYIWPTLDQLVRALFETLKAQDAPFPTISVIAQYLVYESVRQSGIKVLLGGQGGDEAFMGYRKYQLFYLRQLIDKRHYLPMLAFMVQLVPTLIAEARQWNLYWQHRSRYQKKSLSVSNLNLPEAEPINLSMDVKTKLWRRQMADAMQFSLPTLLRYEDRNSMANSIESRLPFLDYHVLELGLAIPEVIKLRKGFGKWGVRAIMQNALPDYIRVARYKRGFDTPTSALVQHGLGKIVRDLLESYSSKIKGFLHKNAKIAEVFSDNQLSHSPQVLAEAIALLWLGESS
jgi:asparagine synthase (glutamine-hydrolysing)